MSGVNMAIVLGNLGRDPEVRTTQSGTKLVTFSVATSERWTDKSTGEQKENTMWHNVVVMSPMLAEVAEKYLVKGSQVYLQGKMQSRKYTDKDGVERSVFEIVLGFDGKLQLVGGAPGGRSETGTNRASANGRHTDRPQSGARGSSRNWEPPGGDLDDEIPF